MTKTLRVLGIETSCDETAAAVVENGRSILSNVVTSQIPIHQPYGGVVPEIASRAHVENIQAVVEAALKGQSPRGSAPFPKNLPVDLIAVTVGPGLVGSLLVGKVVALSGRYDLTLEIGDFTDLFDGYRDDDVYFNTPCHFLPNVTDPSILSKYRRIEIHLAIGENDPFLKNNQLLSRILTSMGVTHKLHLWPGRAHRPQRWKEMVSMLL